jgi:DNA-binding transcriptional LysR family regulator
MYLLQLRTFLEVYRTGSVTKAAARLNITQPAASQHLKSLENSLGKLLFTRKKKGLEPTVLGHELARSMSSAMDTIEHSFSSLKTRSLDISGTVHLASPGEFMQMKAAHILSALLEYGIKFRIQTGNRDFVFDLLHKGSVDLAISASKPTDKTLGFQSIAKEQLLLVASHGWAEKHAIRRMDAAFFKAKSAIAYDEDLPLIRQYFQEVFDTSLEDKAVVTVPDLRSVLAFVYAGAGYTVLPDYLCEKAIKDGSLQVLHQSREVTNTLYLVWPKISLRNPRVVFVRDYLLQAFTK